jgi:anti-sigma-K factor RskA
VSHYDDTTLALLALGETQATADNAAHLTTCAQCRTEVEQLGAVVATGREIQDGDYPVEPPAAVWDRIVAEIRRDQAPSVDERSVAAVVPITHSRPRSRRTRRLPALAAAAAVGLIVGVGGTWSVTRTATPVPVPIAQGQVSVAALQPLDTPAASGTAVLRVVSAAQRSLTVTVANLPAPPGTFYEVWLMDPSNSHLLALGVLGADGHGAYVVPPGLNLAEYTAVDVSLQPMNGSAEHSQHSAVRGVIAA